MDDSARPFPPAGAWAGLVDTLPLAPGVLVFALVYGLAARNAGLTVGETWLMSLAVFAGAAQFSALQVWNSGNAAVIVAVTAIVNLRYLLMGAAIAPHLRRQSWPQKALAAFMLSDESFALAMSRYSRGAGAFAYLIGVNLSLYALWTTASLAGALFQGNLPDLTSYRLDLIFPLAFLGMLMGLVRDRLTGIVALLGAVLALAGAAFLPGKWYLLVAGLGASAVGAALEGAWKTR